MRNLLLMLALSCALWCQTGPAQASPVIRVGEVPTVEVGQVFTVPVFVTGASDLMAFQFDLDYDSTVLLALAFTDVGTDFEAAANAGSGTLTGLSGFLLPGLMSGVADSISGGSSGLTGTGSLVDIQFVALASGWSSLALSSVFLDFTPLDAGSIVNGSVQVPAPGTFALLSLGGLLLAFPRRTGQMTWRLRKRRGGSIHGAN